jgi:hypothetical protein
MSTLIATCVGFLAVISALPAEARIGVAPAVSGDESVAKLEKGVTRDVVDQLRLVGVDPPRPEVVAAHLGTAGEPSVAQCVAAGKSLGLDVLAWIRIRRFSPQSDQLVAILHVVIVATGAETVHEVDASGSELRGAVRGLVQQVLAPLRVGSDTKVADAEQALGRNCDKEYAIYGKSNVATALAFPEYLYAKADRRMRAGRAAAIIVPVALAGLTTGVLLGAFEPWKWNDNEQDSDGDSTNCVSCGFGELFRDFAFIAVAAVGYGAALTALMLSLHAYVRGKRDLAALRPLVIGEPTLPKEERPFEISLLPRTGGAGLSALLRF